MNEFYWFHGKLLKKTYDRNLTLKLLKKNDVTYRKNTVLDKNFAVFLYL